MGNWDPSTFALLFLRVKVRKLSAQNLAYDPLRKDCNKFNKPRLGNNLKMHAIENSVMNRTETF